MNFIKVGVILAVIGLVMFIWNPMQQADTLRMLVFSGLFIAPVVAWGGIHLMRTYRDWQGISVGVAFIAMALFVGSLAFRALFKLG